MWKAGLRALLEALVGQNEGKKEIRIGRGVVWFNEASTQQYQSAFDVPE